MSSKRVLIVDDSSLARVLVRRAVSAAGWEVVGEASDGREGLDLLRRMTPRVVITDFVMPQLGGFEFVKAVLALHPDIKLIVLSSLGSAAVAEEAIQLGVTAVVSKPFEASTLASALERTLDGALRS